VRVAVDAAARVRDADEAEHLDRAVARLGLADLVVGPVRLDQLVADLVEGVQRRERVLEDHRDLPAAHLAHVGVARVEQVHPVERDRPADARVARARQAHHGHRGHRLARAGLADDAQRLPALDRVADAVDGLDDAVLGLEMDLEVLDLQKGLGHGTH
jgi:hypothetical protein